jgi:protein-S-isoprenylcysteine O-methyltransferase Ste14
VAAIAARAVTETQIYDILCPAWIALALVVGTVLFNVPAPYGRYATARAGPVIDGSLGWMLMESVSLVAFVVIFLSGSRRSELVPLILGSLWVAHYVYRAIVQPLRQRGRRRPIPLVIVALGVIFNLVNAYLNARWLTALGPIRSSAWLGQPAFIVGAGLFAAGAAIHVVADETLLDLRTRGSDEYRIPHGLLYRRIACPNYFGEIVEWIGWALATWSLAGASFAVWTAANLIPRARAHHRWYRERFPDYPRERRALVPGLF